MISMGAAARQLGVSKSVLSKAIATGKLSASRNEDGSYAIDPAELARWQSVHGHRIENRQNDREATWGENGTDPSSELAALRVYKQFAEERLTELKAMVEDMRGQRDKWQAAHAQLALTGPKPEEKPDQQPEPKPRPWSWRWLRSTG
jgi:hypothetical protein